MWRRGSATKIRLRRACRLVGGVALLIGMFAVPTARVAACTCILMGDDSAAALKQSDIAFSGTVVLVDPPVAPGGAPALGGGPISYLFEVDGVAKGEVAPLVGVLSGSGGGDCGITFERGARWLVFANREIAEGAREADTGALWTSICAGNLPLEPGEPPPVPVSARISRDAVQPQTSVPAEVLVALGAAVAIALVSGYLFTRAGRPR